MFSLAWESHQFRDIIFAVCILVPRASFDGSCLNLAGSWEMNQDEGPERQGEDGPGTSDAGWKIHGNLYLFSSLELDRDGADGALCFLPESSPLSVDYEEYLTLTSTSAGQLPCEECLEADSETIPLPQFCSLGAFLKSSLPEGSQGSESDWEDLDEPVDRDEVLRWVSHSV